MNKGTKILLITTTIISLGSIVIVIYNILKPIQKIAWVELSQVYEKFEMRQELETKAKNVAQARKAVTDSLEFELKMLERQINAEQGKNREKINIYEIKREQYLKRKQEFDEDNENMVREYDNQVVTQVNQYMKDFGRERGYKYILGANGTGSMMYADEAEDITGIVNEYINTRYKGIKE